MQIHVYVKYDASCICIHVHSQALIAQSIGEYLQGLKWIYVLTSQ